MASARVNVMVLVAVLSLFLHRVQDVGLAEALAEVLCLSDLYTYYVSSFWPLQPELFRDQPAEFWLDAPLAAALALPNSTHRAHALLSLVHDHGHGVFSLPLLRDEVARRLSREVDHFVASDHVSASPNSMNDHGVVLGADGLEGLDGLLRLLVLEVLSPLAALLYDDREPVDSAAAAAAARAVNASACCTTHHAFVVLYDASQQRGLDNHHDASEVTLNVMLSREDESAENAEPADADKSACESADEFVGGSPSTDGTQLRFCGFVGDIAHRRYALTLRHSVGRAVVHLGAHRHGAAELARGTRKNLVVWGRRQFHSSDEVPPGAARLHASELPPDLECLSWTHDADFDETYSSRGMPLPAAAIEHREKRQQTEELLDLASRATDAHIEALPPHHQPIVRFLRQAAQQSQQQPPPAADQAD